MEKNEIKHVIEAALLAAGRPLTLDQLRGLFGEESPLERTELRAALDELQQDYDGRGIMVNEVASGFRIEVRPAMAPWLGRLWEERPPRYSRALMETLAIVAYRQPVTRGDVEQIRGVVVTTNIMRTLMERGWIKVVGYRDVPGKPAMYGTTREFLDYFGLRHLEDLPPLAEIRDLDRLTAQLDLGEGGFAAEAAPGTAEPLVRPLDPHLPAEPATVASIAEARAAALVAHVEVAAGTDAAESADVIPLQVR
ncbi:MAG: SMC-Scp complex subunit ScpB [Gammaproteobacteria bacterium]|nr:MAG: SMC-Scp complex subunit ScpB [Gammaproteobacteria bacterium]